MINMAIDDIFCMISDYFTPRACDDHADDFPRIWVDHVSWGVAVFFSAQVALLLNFLGGAICAHIAPCQ